MKESEFRETLDALCATNSRNDKKDIIREVSDSSEAISILEGEEFDDIGLGKKTVRKVAERAFPSLNSDASTVTEAVAEWDDSEWLNDLHPIDGHDYMVLDPDVDDEDVEYPPHDEPLSEVYTLLTELDTLSGNAAEDHLYHNLLAHQYPSVIVFGILDDLPTGVSGTTIANALDWKEHLPFHDGCYEIAEADEPLTEPQAGKSFDPMLAVPESRGRPDNPVAQTKVDGYRCLIHVGRTFEEYCNDEKSDDTVRAFSRRGNEITESLPELEEIPFDNVDAHYILDCEVIAETGSYSDTSSRIGRDADNVEREHEMHFKVFDVPMLGSDLSGIPYKKRWDRAQSIIEAIDDDRLELMSYTEDIEMAKDRAAANGNEGIIIKDLEGPYEYGKRSSYWVKEKMDDETVDLKISGVKEGEGRLSGTMGKVLLETSDGIGLGNCGSGWTDEQRDEVWSNQDDWIGRTIEVEARGLGTQSQLRMPIYKRDRSDDGSPDSWERVQEVMQDV